MKAVHLKSGTVRVRECPVPERAPGFALLRMRVAGICNTDLELQRGYYGFNGTPGHEFVADVVEADSPELVGKRVVGEINIACGTCAFCAAGLGRHCATRSVLGIVKHPGAFSEFLTLPETNLHLVPESIRDEQAVFVEPLAAACEILDQVPISPGEPVAVLGDGKLGLLIAQVMHAHGARVTVFGRHPEKLAILHSCGISTSAARDHPVSAYRIVIEATGSAEGLREAILMTLPRGTVVMKSTIHGAVSIDTARVIVNEISLLGSRCGRFEPALELLEHGDIKTSSMLSAEFALAQAPAAFAEAARPGVLKVLLRNAM